GADEFCERVEHVEVDVGAEDGAAGALPYLFEAGGIVVATRDGDFDRAGEQGIPGSFLACSFLRLIEGRPGFGGPRLLHGDPGAPQQEPSVTPLAAVSAADGVGDDVLGRGETAQVEGDDRGDDG